MTPALVVLADPGGDPFLGRLAALAREALSHHGPVDLVDLRAEGFRTVMSEAERRAYHGPHPILDPQVGAHATLVAAAGTLVFVYPSRPFGPPALLKGWFDRVLVPGVAFVFDERRRVRPNLSRLRRIAGVTTYPGTRREARRHGDGGGRLLLRVLRLNSPHRVRTAWWALYEADRAGPGEREELARRVEREL